jgi:hypothetical protein
MIMQVKCEAKKYRKHFLLSSLPGKLSKARGGGGGDKITYTPPARQTLVTIIDVLRRVARYYLRPFLAYITLRVCPQNTRLSSTPAKKCMSVLFYGHPERSYLTQLQPIMYFDTPSHARQR